MKKSVEFTEHVSYPPARVWAALTEPSLVAKWWATGDVQPIVGHRFTLNMGPFGEQVCEVLSVEPEKSFSYSFGVGWLDTTITWTLDREGGGTKLTLRHSGFDTESEMGRRAFEGMGSGWPAVLKRIEPALAQA